MSTRKSAHKRPMNVRKAGERLHRLVLDTTFPLSLVVPPFDEREIAEARFESNEILTQLSKPREGDDVGAPSRRRTLIATMMYQSIVLGIEGFFEKAARAARQGGGENNEKGSTTDDSSKETLPG